MHLVVVHLDVASQISAPALEHIDFLAQLGVLHLDLAEAILCTVQLDVFFFDNAVGLFDLLADGGIVALHGALQLDSLRRANFQLSVLFAQSFKLSFDSGQIVAKQGLLLTHQHLGRLRFVVASALDSVDSGTHLLVLLGKGLVALFQLANQRL